MRPLILIVGIVYIFQKMLAEPHDNYLFVNDLVCMARKLLTLIYCFLCAFLISARIWDFEWEFDLETVHSRYLDKEGA